MSDSCQIFKEDKYVILIDGRNYVVSQLKPDTQEIKADSNTYHLTIAQALQEVSRRMLNERLSNACKNRTLSLLQLSDEIKAHEIYISAKFEVQI